MPIAPPSLSRDLLDWYDRHARTLPWRVSPQARAEGTVPDPYRVWLSEIMLQQTTVATVKSYFARFVNRWPGVADLAAAPEAEVLGAWAGLGYYARARNLHACARTVAVEHGGTFPQTAAALRALPGIGEYTSAAIAAIAFNEAATVVDGNIERVVTRLFAIETPLPAAKKEIRSRTGDLTPDRRPGDFAQAMMDLGATICTPTRPACVICPIRPHCRAAAEGRAEAFPVKKPKAEVPSRRGAAFVAIRPGDGAVWLRKRATTGMLGGMSEPPSSNWSARADGTLGVAAAPFPADWQACGTVLHGFTHFKLSLDVYRADLGRDPPGDGWWSPPAVWESEALPTLMRKVLAIAVPGDRPTPPRGSS